MILTSNSGQPYIPGKNTSYAAQPAWSRPITAFETTSDLAPFGKARPIKHWRKQLVPRHASGLSNAAISMPFDKPSSSVNLGSNNCSCDDDKNIQTIVSDMPGEKNVVFSEGTKLVGEGCPPASVPQHPGTSWPWVPMALGPLKQD